jgi:hypothetical protein
MERWSEERILIYLAQIIGRFVAEWAANRYFSASIVTELLRER